MSPDVPVGDLSEPYWRFRSVTNFVRARHSDLGRGALDEVAVLELNAVGGATIETGYASAAATPHEADRLIGRSENLAGEFFGAVVLRAETDPSLRDSDQLYEAACFQVAARQFTYPITAEGIPHVRNKIRWETAKRLLQIHERLTTKLAEYGDEDHGPEVASLFTVRAEFLTAAALMRKGHDYQSPEETSIVLPALARQSNSLIPVGDVDHKWGTSMWRLDGDAGQRTSLSLLTPPDAKLQIKHAGTQKGATRYDASITYVSLINEIVQTEDEERIGEIVTALKREASRSRGVLTSYWRDELDFVTRNARAKAGFDE